MGHFFRKHPLADIWKNECNPYIYFVVYVTRNSYTLFSALSFIYISSYSMYVVFIITYLTIHKINMVKLAFSNNFIQNSYNNIFFYYLISI